MARAKSNKLYRTFVKGLITEAGYLTFPEDASYSESNTILSRKGNRTRRLGLDFEEGYQLLSHGLGNTEAFNEFAWRAVNNKAELSLLVYQCGRYLYFYSLEQTPISDSYKPFFVDLALYAAPGASVDSILNTHCQFSSGKGFLFVTHPYVEPLLIEYKEATDTITTNVISILVRDFEGVDDGLSNDEEPLSLSKEHHYNLQNQGWVGSSSNSTKVNQEITLDGYNYRTEYDGMQGFENVVSYQQEINDTPIFQFQAKVGRYPGNNKQWWVARAASDDDTLGIKAGDFIPDTLNKLFSGNNRAPRGHYILNAFKKDRSGVSGVLGIDIVETGIRPSTTSFFSGRAWFASGSNVYYSQILDSKNKAGLCYQEADPTSEDISDLIASDGGTIPIPEAESIVRLVPQSNGMMVFALNGVWFVSGGNSGFSATDISVSKVSAIGTRSPLAIVSVDDGVFWWSEVGINALQQASGQYGPIPGKFGNTNISETTIQTLYNGIEDNKRAFAKGQYDPKNNVVQWIWADETVDYNYRYNHVINYDVTLQAFYTWEISSNSATPMVAGVLLESDVVSQRTDSFVVSDAGNVLDGVDNVVSSVYNTIVRPSSLVYPTVTLLGEVTFSKFNSYSFVDWEAFDSVGQTYESYVETGFELLNDAMRKKQAVYVFVYLRRTEDDPVPADSSCKMQLKWDWSANSYSGKWTTEIEAYRPRLFIKDASQPLEGAFPVVISRNKVRGTGKSLQFKFGTSERGKTFDLLGWSVPYVGNTEP